MFETISNKIPERKEKYITIVILKKFLPSDMIVLLLWNRKNNIENYTIGMEKMGDEICSKFCYCCSMDVRDFYRIFFICKSQSRSPCSR